MHIRRLVPVLLVVLMVATLSVTPAVAVPRGKGSNGGNGGGGKTPPAVMVVEPNPATAWGGDYAVTGSGFYPNQWVSLSVAAPGCCLAFNKWADSNGTISFTRVAGDPGTYTINAYQLKGHRYVLMASVSFDAVEP